MTFWKVSDTRMNCLITEAEIAALGYSLEDLTQDRGAYRRILNLLLKKGKKFLGLTQTMESRDFTVHFFLTGA